MDDDRRQAPLLMAAIFRCCPRCGVGAVFDGFLKIKPACAVCGLDLTKADSGDGPAVFGIFIIGPIAAAIAFWFQVAYQPTVWAFMGVLSCVILILSWIILPILKAGLVALQYRHQAGEGRLED